jgi:hypothetical protein
MLQEEVNNKKKIWFIKEKLLLLLDNPKYIIYFMLITTVLASIARYYQGCGLSQNYYIYRFSSIDMLSGNNLYVSHPGLNFFLYSPTFPVLFLPLLFLPSLLGNLLWNLLTVIPLLIAIYLLPIKGWRKSLIYLYPFLQFLITVQLSQADNLILALVIFIFVALEKNKYLWAAFCASFGFFIKIYGIGFAVLFLMYKKKVKFIVSAFIWLIIIFLLPLIFIKFNFNYLIDQYTNWIASIGYDTTHNTNVIGFCRWLGFFRYTTNNVPIVSHLQIISLTILALPIFRASCYKSDKFRLFFLSSLLIWVTIFNPKAESSQYLIALTGVAIWFGSQNIKPWVAFLMIFTYIVSSLMGTDIFHFMKLFVLNSGIQTIPCFIIWVIIQYQLLFTPFDNNKSLTKG